MKLEFFPLPFSVKEKLGISIGVFDGVHLGHQKVIERLVSECKKRGLKSAVLTFPLPPSWYLKDQAPVPLLLPPLDKIKRIRKLGVEKVYFLDFFRIRDMMPEKFFKDIILPQEVYYIVIGEDFRFGKGKMGTAEELKMIGEKEGVEVDIVPAFRVEGTKVSSTKIRQLIKEGELKKAGQLLGYPYPLIGKVIAGGKKGRKLGFPTINLRITYQVTPPVGVYYGRVKVGNEEYPAAIDIRKLRKRWLVEAHLLDFQGDLYRKKVEVMPLGYLRERKKVPEEVLKNLIRKDIERVVEIMKKGRDYEN